MKAKKELNIQIGSRVKTAREAMRYTQENLAERIDVSVQYISDLERGVVGASLPTMIKLCQVLHTSSDFLLMGKEHCIYKRIGGFATSPKGGDSYANYFTYWSLYGDNYCQAHA